MMRSWIARLVGSPVLWLLFASGAFPSTVSAADLTGRWLHEETSADGNTTQIILVFQQTGSQLSGRVIFSWGQLRFSGGSTDGKTFHFNLMTPADDTHPAKYEGAIKGDELQVASHWPGNNNTQYTAKRTSNTMGDPPARIELPALHPVPYNGLAATPPMGWNSWNYFQGKVNDAVVRAAADAMAGNGMRDAGYVYINIDDTWEGKRDTAGNIQSNKKFPDMKALADYVHSKGLKLGIYSSPGPKTCGGYEGSYGHEQQDATTYAQWGIDYLKYDWCSAGRIYGKEDLQAVYQKMGDALQATGRPIVYSLCEYGMGDVWKWGPSVGANLWRTTGDISDNWSALDYTGFAQSDLAPFAAPGHWNDPDMLEVGNGGMTDDEYRTHMSLWALLAAPLLAGNDVRTIPAATRAVLLNSEVIAVDQDPAGHQAKRVSKQGDFEIWGRPLKDGSFAVGLFNRGLTDADIDVHWSDLGISQSQDVRDLWSHSTTHSVREGYKRTVPMHGVVMIKIQTAQVGN
jgi:alpha-galactosidase